MYSMNSHVDNKHKHNETLRMLDAKGQTFLESIVVNNHEKEAVLDLLKTDLKRNVQKRRSKEVGTTPAGKKDRTDPSSTSESSCES